MQKLLPRIWYFLGTFGQKEIYKVSIITYQLQHDTSNSFLTPSSASSTLK